MPAPEFIRYFARDFIEGAVVSLLALTIAGDTESVLKTAVIAVGVAAVAAARRNLDRFKAFLNGALGTNPED